MVDYFIIFIQYSAPVFLFGSCWEHCGVQNYVFLIIIKWMFLNKRSVAKNNCTYIIGALLFNIFLFAE